MWETGLKRIDILPFSHAHNIQVSTKMAYPPTKPSALRNSKPEAELENLVDEYVRYYAMAAGNKRNPTMISAARSPCGSPRSESGLGTHEQPGDVSCS